MLSKLSRFLTIAALTTLTCLITHPGNAKPGDVKLITPTMEVGNSNSSNIEELFDEAYWQHPDDFHEYASVNDSWDNIISQQGLSEGSLPHNHRAKDALLLYTILTDYFKQMAERESTVETKNLADSFDLLLSRNFRY